MVQAETVGVEKKQAGAMAGLLKRTCGA